jgi:hypothetical protein
MTLFKPHPCDRGLGSNCSTCVKGRLFFLAFHASRLDRSVSTGLPPFDRAFQIGKLESTSLQTLKMCTFGQYSISPSFKVIVFFLKT